ncbi:MAG: helix-turn-helix transcriptional regulator [Bacteroidota bacterium]
MIKAGKSKLLTLVGSNIREQRKAQGLTQQQLAYESGLELSQVNRIELGKINTSVLQIAKICKVLDINPDKIFNFNIDEVEIE